MIMGKKIRRTTRPRQPAAPQSATGGKHVVYVHGICRHDPGYSDGWWNALRPHLTTVPAANRHEVLWSDLVTSAVPLAARASELPAAREVAEPLADPGQVELAAAIQDVLADRAERELVRASVESAGGEALTSHLAQPAAAFSLPGVGCLDDFIKYLTDSSLRDQVIGRFRQVVEPLLAGAGLIEVVSHSWGTVVAYEALRLMDADISGTGVVRHLFTLGSALSIPPVKRRLLPQAIDGAKPRLVGQWINLDARFDVVGGSLQSNPFQVDEEFLELPPVGCSTVIPNPRCAHSSYFHPSNLAVNRDILARAIDSPG